jgi:transcription elongation factor Elf1
MSDTTDPDITEAPKPARICWACHEPTEADPCECGKPSQNELAFCDVPAEAQDEPMTERESAYHDQGLMKVQHCRSCKRERRFLGLVALAEIGMMSCSVCGLMIQRAEKDEPDAGIDPEAQAAIDAVAEAQLASEEPESEPDPKPRTYRVLEHVDIWIDFELTPEQRLTAADRVVEKGDAVAEAEATLVVDTELWRARKKALDAKIETAKRESDEARRAYHTGIEARLVRCERRADIPTATIQIVRPDGVVHESKAMDEKQQALHCKQGDITDVTGGATVTPKPEGEPELGPIGEAMQRAEAKKDERNEHGFPAEWTDDKTWSVSLGKDQPKHTLTADDVRLVWLTLSRDEGHKPAALADEPRLKHLPVQAISHALSKLLRDKGMARLDMGKWYLVPFKAKASSPQPGRKDALPESEASRSLAPKRSEPTTMADALLADAAEVAAAYVPAGAPS